VADPTAVCLGRDRGPCHEVSLAETL